MPLSDGEVASLNQRALSLYREGRYREALGPATRAAEAAEGLGDAHPATAQALTTLGLVHKARGEVSEAEPLLRRALEIVRRASGDRHTAYARAMNNLGVLLRDAGRYGEAEALFRGGHAIFLSAQGDVRADLASGLDNLAQLLQARGDDEEAELQFREALDIARRVHGRSDPAVATPLAHLGELYLSRNDYERAEPLLREALDIERSAHEGHPDVAALLQNLAFLLQEGGRWAEAQQALEEALGIFRSALGESSPPVATILDDLAGVHFSRGDVGTAERLYRQAVEVSKASRGDEHPEVAAALVNLGAFRGSIGDAASSEDLLLQALAIVNGAPGRKDPQTVAVILGNLASGRFRNGDHATAEGLLRTDLEITRDSAGPDHPATAAEMASLGGLFLETGRYAEGEELLREAVEITRTTPEATRTLGRRLVDLAWAHRVRGDFAGAEREYQEAVENVRAFWGDSHPEVAHDLWELALVVAAHDDRAGEALRTMEEAVLVNDGVVAKALSVASERQRLAFLESMRGALHGFVSLVLRGFREDPRAVGMALDHVLRRKALGAEAVAAQRDAVVRAHRPDLASTVERLAGIRMRVAQKTLAGPGPAGAEDHSAALGSLAAEQEELEQELAGAFPELDLERRLERADRAAVAAALPEGSALVEFIRFDPFDFQAVPARGEQLLQPPRYAAFVMRAGEPDQVALVDLGQAEDVDRSVAAFREAITGGDGSAGGNGGGANDGSKDEGSGEALRRWVFDPLVPHLRGRTRLFLSPDGDLARLPFESLPLPDGDRLIVPYRVSYVSSGRDVIRFGAEVSAEAAEPFVAADPDFDLRDEAGPGLEKEEEDGAGDHVSRDLRGGVRKPFPRLRGTGEEGAAVGGALGVSPLLGASVLERTVKARPSPWVLHLATHGFFLPDQPRDLAPDLRGTGAPADDSGIGRLRSAGSENPLLRSGLALAGANTFLERGSLPPEAEDGILTAEDVAGLDLLGTELVVLSACETGLGEVRTGEGVFGLRRAFVLAGAGTLVMSLWNVPDAPTRELMEGFYRRLMAGEPRAEALRQAQLELMEDYPHPWFWGAFICQGDPGPLRERALRAGTGMAATAAAAAEGPEPVREPMPEREPSGARELPWAEVMEGMGLKGRRLEGGSMALPFASQRAEAVIVHARPLLHGVYSFEVVLPGLPRRRGRDDALRTLLRVSFDASYAKVVLVRGGHLLLTVELPGSVVTPRVAEGIVRSLAALGDLRTGDLADEALWSRNLRAAQMTLEDVLGPEVQEATGGIVAAVEEADLLPEEEGGPLLLRPDLPIAPLETSIRAARAVISLVAPFPGVQPGERRMPFDEVLAVNGQAKVAKVGLDPAGELVLLYEVPRLTPRVLEHARHQFGALVDGLATVWVD